MAIYTYRHYQPGTFQEHFRNKELEFSKENAPSKLPEAKCMRYVSIRL